VIGPRDEQSILKDAVSVRDRRAIGTLAKGTGTRSVWAAASD